ncbi:MAG: ABC transporter permease [Ruminiclostridium sp.]|nr:ABC transporter permease [Ruminiclostridium sp.]
MRKTKWMVLCLFIGFLMAAGMMSTVPIYMDASLQRTLIKDMEAYQLSSGEYPGIYAVERTFPESAPASERIKEINELPATVKSRVDYLPIPVGAQKTVLFDNMLYLATGGTKGTSNTRMKLAAMTGFTEHISITSGRIYCEGSLAEDGVYEAVANETALRNLGITLGGEYPIKGGDTSAGDLIVRVVGIYEQSDPTDIYWSEKTDGYASALIIDYDCFCDRLAATGMIKPASIAARYALDYRKMDMNDLAFAVNAIDEDAEFYPTLNCKFTMGVLNIWKSYAKEAEKLTGILWVLQIPTMVMLAFYLFMVSRLNVEQEKNEIAVFKSRGAGSLQIFGMYALEAGILGVVTLICAPFLGLLMCRFLGVSDGFLEFVNRTGISAKITSGAILYSLLAAVIFFAATMIPIIPASKLSIVQYKQSRTKVIRMSLWEKTGIDFLLIAAAIVFYAFYTADEQISTVSTGDINPLFFIFSTCLIFGLGLLFIRVYPYLLNLIYIVFKPLWTPAQYMAITTVCRSQGGRERFLMLFLVVTFSLGIFSANTARTINDQKEDRIRYADGADIVLKEYWLEATSTEPGAQVSGYVERDFERFEELEGVETATKVLVNKKAKVTVDNKTESNVTLMSVEPYKFANTAWFRNDLLPVHWWNYIKALQDYPSGVIISRALADKYEIQLGDAIDIRWSANEKISAPVLAVVDYWPGINPNVSANTGKNNKKTAKNEETGEEDEELITSYAVNCFAVMNYYYTSSVSDLEPYEVWIKLKEGASSSALYSDISAKRMPIEKITDASQQLITVKNQPQLQGMNGALTLSFVVIMIMTIIGFLIYWILSIRSRTLQFGILRAMGVTFREIIGMIGYEQILVSGVSLAMSFVIGGIASDMFVPLFRSMYNPADQVPPFLVAASQSDYIKLYVIIVLMLGGGFAILGALIRKININKALKLGED